MSWLLAVWLAAAGLAPLHGVVRGGGVPVPGATVTLSQGQTTLRTLTAADGSYEFADLTAGAWTVRVSMTGFETATQTVTVGEATPALDFTLRLAPYAGPPAGTAPPQSQPAVAAAPPGAPQAVIVNGSESNAAASPFAQPAAFGNFRPPLSSLFNGGFGLSFDTSALDARSFSFTGQDTPKPSANNLDLFAQFGGPLLIPRLTHANNAPEFFLGYQRQTTRTAVTTAALVPTDKERGGNLSALPGPIVDPATGQAFSGSQVPSGRISAQAKALLALYPEPNVNGGNGYNYQAPLIGNHHQDELQTRLDKFFSAANQLAGTFTLRSIRSDAGNLFGFDDRTRSLGINSEVQWRHAFTPMLRTTFAVRYNSLSNRTVPFFAGVRNVSGEAGIAGNDTSPEAWGPPALNFSGGWAGLSDDRPLRNRDQTVTFAADSTWNHGDHSLSWGADLRRLQFNYRQQANPRGSFTFNGAASGNDFADFLLGIPDAATLGFGNADKYLRQSAVDAYLTDDWRLHESLSLSLGARWEYQAPMTERYGRLANLALAPDFSSAATVTGAAAALAADHSGFEPRLGLAWRPLAASSLLVRAGYGIYYDTSVYSSLALRMAQQAPFATSLSVAGTPAAPLSLATAFLPPPGPTADVFAVDPRFRIGYAQTWTLSAQHDLSDGMVATVKYTGTKGTRQKQQFLPNTVAPGAVNPCAACPLGFVYLTSNGNSTYNAGSVELQRRLHSGLAFTLQYTYAHALDDAILGSAGAGFTAQDWRHLDAERGPSDFDQRHKLSLTAQYSSQYLVRRNPLLRGWTLTSQLTAASGLPLTPITYLVMPGTGFTGIRPDLTGAPVADGVAGGRFLNPAAYTLPAAGSWGDAGRNSIRGPRQFSLDAALQRSFPAGPHLTGLLRIDANNALNHVA
ncbi:MAG: carboxypeptidase regulatory-like domain-containing protein, partial [Terriglobales bacterium]